MRRITVIVLAALVFAYVGVSATTWNVDPVHSTVQFSVSHMTISKVTGKFNDFSGTLNFDGNNLEGGSVEFTVKVASVNTNNENRDGHLKSDDFFNVETYPEITFKSKQVIPGEGNKFQLVGDLTMRDVTKEVTFDCEYNGSIPMKHGRKAGFSAESTINRHDFNVAFNRALEGGGLVVGNDVKLSLDLEFAEQVEEAEG
jgi:polyisoprenoid-binding protein YceI